MVDCKMMGRWSNDGQTMVKCWSNVGQMLFKCWSNVGQMLVKCWSNDGEMLLKGQRPHENPRRAEVRIGMRDHPTIDQCLTMCRCWTINVQRILVQTAAKQP